MATMSLILSYLLHVYFLLKHKFPQDFKAVRLKEKILKSRPILVGQKTSVCKAEIFSITSAKDYPFLILAIKTFSFFSKNCFLVTIIDDGSLSEKNIQDIKSHLIGCRVLTQKKIHKKMKEKLGEKSLIYQHRKVPYILKKTTPLLFSRRDKVMLLDSDVLFFQKPSEIWQWEKGQFDSFFIQDFESSYLLSDLETKTFFDVLPLPKVNSGLLGIYSHQINLDILEKLIKHSTLSVGRPLQYQIFFAILFQQNLPLKTVKRLPKTYCISQTDENPETLICRHYTHYSDYMFKLYLRDAENVLANFKN